MWNYPYATKLTLDRAHGTVAKGTTNSTVGKDTYTQTAGSEALFPGSVLLPKGDLHHNVDTNGRILVGKNLYMDSQEHHNAPWVGFEEPQCFTVNGKTSVTLN